MLERINKEHSEWKESRLLNHKSDLMFSISPKKCRDTVIFNYQYVNYCYQAVDGEIGSRKSLEIDIDR